MQTRVQKEEQVKKITELIKQSGSLAFGDFTGVPTKAILKLKATLRASGATYRVTKKRLLRVALKASGIDADPKAMFKEQLGTIFAPGDILSVASIIYKFSRELAKEKKEFKLLGGYDLAGKAPISAEQFVMLAKLPGRETLLAQVMGMFTAPLRQFMSIVDQLSKKGSGAEAEAKVVQ